MAALVQDYLEPLLKYQKKQYFEEENEASNETEYSYLRLLPDMSEGLIGLCIGDIMGILLSLDSNNNLNLQQQQILKLFIETLLKTSKSSFSIFKLSILYLYKLNKKLREPAILNIFKTNLSQKNILSMEPMSQAKLLFVVILMLAFKYTEDHCYYISAWSKATGIKSDIIHKVEVTVLNILDHNLFVSQERFESFSNRIIQKINKLKIDLLQSVKISYASSNYSSSEEESAKSDDSSLSVRCRKCCCKRKQDCIENSSFKKRRMQEALTINTNDTTQNDDKTSSFYTLPTTLYNYYKNKNGIGMAKQPLTPPTPNTYPTAAPVRTNAAATYNNFLQVDSLIIPSTPPTSQTSIYEDMEREEEIKNSDEDYEYEEDEEIEEEELPKSRSTLNNGSMAFILNPDENKIQFDSGETQKIQARTIPYRYHTPSPKSNFSYNNLKKVNLLKKKNEKTRTTASIVLPNTSPVSNVASVFPSLSMLSQPQRDSNTIEDTINKPKSIGLQSLLNQNLNSIIVNKSQNSISNKCPLSKTNYMNIRNDDTNTTNQENNNNCPYLNHLYSLSNDDVAKQNILLSIYNCYAMRNIRHYQI
jgi:hypothetical protein